MKISNTLISLRLIKEVLRVLNSVQRYLGDKEVLLLNERLVYQQSW